MFHYLFSLTNEAIILFEKYSDGDLLLDNEPEIKQKMKELLTYNSAKIMLETSFNQYFKGEELSRVKAKEKALSEMNVKRQLASNFRNFKKEFNIFEKLPHFAVTRLKVSGKCVED